MSVSQAQLNRAISQAHAREAQGYFERARQGDQKAASLFVRMVAYDLNPNGLSSDYGWLSKRPGESQVDGYAEDAICGNADPNDLQNAVDMVNGAGAPGASIGGAVRERRPTNNWVAPQPLTADEVVYLLYSGEPHPPTPTPPTYPVPPRDEALDEMHWLDAYYASPEGLQRPNGLSLNGKPDFEGIAAWYLDIYQNERMKGKSRADARAAYVTQIRHSDEWKQKHPGETP